MATSCQGKDMGQLFVLHETRPDPFVNSDHIQFYRYGMFLHDAIGITDRCPQNESLESVSYTLAKKVERYRDRLVK